MIIRFRDLSIRTKLLGGFGAVIALAIVLGVVMLVQISSVKSHSDQIAKDDLVGNQLIAQITANEGRYRIGQLWNIANVNDGATRAPLHAAATAAAQITKEFASYKPLISGAADMRHWQEGQANWKAYVAATTWLLNTKANTTQPKTVKLADDTATTFSALDADLTAWTKLNDGFAAADTASADSTYNSAVLIGIILLALAVIIGLSVALIVSGSIKRAVDLVLDRLWSLQQNHVADVQSGLGAFADGDLTQEYHPVTEPIPNPAKDEIGQVGSGVNAIRDSLEEAIGAYNRTRAKLNEVVGQIGSSATSVSSASEQLTSSSNESGRAADESGRAAGEIAQAIGDIAQGSQRQVEIVGQVRTSAEEVGRAVGEIARGAERQVESIGQMRTSAEEVGRAIGDIARGAERQVRAVAEVKSSADLVSAAVTDAARSAKETASMAHDARQVAQAGVSAAETASDAMASVRDSSQEVHAAIRELAAKSDQIGQIVQTITGIAEQTNLLALNAAIEAARAGEQGRGFAVVADEVRKLAEESQTAASEIGQLITAIQDQTEHAVDVVGDGAKRTDEGVEVVAETRAAFMRIGEAVEEMTVRIDHIAKVSEEITGRTEAMQASINSVAVVAEDASASAQQVAASAQQVSASADEVASSAEQASASAQQVAASAQQVAASADEVATSAEQSSSSTEEVSASAEQVSAATQETSASAQEVAAAAQSLSSNAEVLAELVAQFQVTRATEVADRSVDKVSVA